MAGTSQTRARQNLELTFLGFLVSLVLKSAMDTLFNKHEVTDCQDWQAFWDYVWSPLLFQFGVFLFTLMRFMYGAYRFHETPPTTEPTIFFVLWHAVGMIILFILFYLCALTIKHPVNFYALMGVCHAWDLVWFLVALCSGSLGQDARRAIGIFIVLDAITLLVLVIMLWRHMFLSTSPNSPLLWWGGGALFTLGIVDFIWNHKFYFGR